MTYLLVALCFTALIGCFLAFTRAQHWADAANESLNDCQLVSTAFRDDRARLTSLERDVDALRRELRKLGGRFYALAAELEEPEPNPVGVITETSPVCENWSTAQREGPLSPAAQCACAYCERRRAERAARRANLRSGVKS